jgi:hypothetical protein
VGSEQLGAAYATEGLDHGDVELVVGDVGPVGLDKAGGIADVDGLMCRNGRSGRQPGTL